VSAFFFLALVSMTRCRWHICERLDCNIYTALRLFLVQLAFVTFERASTSFKFVETLSSYPVCLSDQMSNFIHDIRQMIIQTIERPCPL
jgi:hypothetical protein